MTSMFFDGWQPILRVIVLGPIAYASLVTVLRLSGKRTLSKMNAFDFVVTIAFGSVLAGILLNTSVALVTGVAVFVVLVASQFVVSWLSVHSQRFERLVKAEPSLLYHDGRLLESEMRRVRVTERELIAAVREQGHGSLDEVRAVVLENDSSFSVLTGNGELSVLRTVEPQPDPSGGEPEA